MTERKGHRSPGHESSRKSSRKSTSGHGGGCSSNAAGLRRPKQSAAQAPTTREVDCPGYLHNGGDARARSDRRSSGKERRDHRDRRTSALSESDKASILGKKEDDEDDPASSTAAAAEDADVVAVVVIKPTNVDRDDVIEQELVTAPSLSLNRDKHSAQEKHKKSKTSTSRTTRSPSRRTQERSSSTKRNDPASRSSPSSRSKHRTRNHANEATSSSHGAPKSSSLSGTNGEARKRSSHQKGHSGSTERPPPSSPCAPKRSLPTVDEVGNSGTTSPSRRNNDRSSKSEESQLRQVGTSPSRRKDKRKPEEPDGDLPLSWSYGASDGVSLTNDLTSPSQARSSCRSEMPPPRESSSQGVAKGSSSATAGEARTSPSERLEEPHIDPQLSANDGATKDSSRSVEVRASPSHRRDGSGLEEQRREPSLPTNDTAGSSSTTPDVRTSPSRSRDSGRPDSTRRRSTTDEARRSPSRRKDRSRPDEAHRDRTHDATKCSLSTTDESRTSPSRRRKDDNGQNEPRRDSKKSDAHTRRSDVDFQAADRSPSRRKTGSRSRNPSRAQQHEPEVECLAGGAGDSIEPMPSISETEKSSSLKASTHLQAATNEVERAISPAPAPQPETFYDAFNDDDCKPLQLPRVGSPVPVATSPKQPLSYKEDRSPSRRSPSRRSPSHLFPRSQLAVGNAGNEKIEEFATELLCKFGHGEGIGANTVNHEKENHGDPNQTLRETTSNNNRPLSERARRSNPLEKSIYDNNAKAYGGFTADLKDSERSEARRLFSQRPSVVRSKSGCDIAAAASSVRGQLQRSKSLILRRPLSDKRLGEGSIRKGVDECKSKSSGRRHDTLMPISETDEAPSTNHPHQGKSTASSRSHDEPVPISKTAEDQSTEHPHDRPKNRTKTLQRRKSLVNLTKTKDPESDRREKVKVHTGTKDPVKRSPTPRSSKLDSKLLRLPGRSRASDSASVTPKLREESKRMSLEW